MSAMLLGSPKVGLSLLLPVPSTANIYVRAPDEFLLRIYVCCRFACCWICATFAAGLEAVPRK